MNLLPTPALQMDGKTSQTSASSANEVEDKPCTSVDELKYNPGNYSDPVFKQIAMNNGIVNKMSKEELKDKLGQLRLDTRGLKEVLRKRLKAYYQRQKLIQARVKLREKEEFSEYLVVIDFEATCEENDDAYPHEIIEFPAVLVCTKTRIIVDEFHEYCRPRINPILTNFCKTLTGITQEMVDKSDYFPEVLEHFESWMEKLKLGTGKTFTIATDGPWDMSRFLHSQCNQCRIAFPKWARGWLNIRKIYRNYYGFRNAKLTVMLESLGMEFEGQQHSGIDDARNIARVALRLLNDGARMQPNERIYSCSLKENKRICIGVVSYANKIESGQDEIGVDEQPEETNDNSDRVQYTYKKQGQFSLEKNRRANNPKKQQEQEKSDRTEEVVEDVSDLMYWMSLKGKKP